jgi:hypothetical protein
MTENVCTRLAERDGFVLPIMIFALMLMATIAAVALATGEDERLSSQAMRESSELLYAAEAGLQKVWATWPDTAVAELAAGEELDLGWQALDGGSSYRAVIRRIDSGTRRMYALTVYSRGGGARSGQREVSYFFTGGRAAFGDNPFERAAVVANGEIHFGDDDRSWNGHNYDTIPSSYGLRSNGIPWANGDDKRPAGWAAGDCDPPTEEKPAIVVDNENNLDTHPENDGFHWEINGGPASESIDWAVPDNQLNSTSIFEFDELTRDDLIAMADHVLEPWSGDGDFDVHMTRPTLNPDGTCNTDDPYNWGSPDPNHPCYNYFPIIYFPDGLEVRPPRNPAYGNERNWWECPDYYGQAIVIADGPLKMGGSCWTPDEASTTQYTFNGIVLVDGCLELQYWTTFNGTAVVNDNMPKGSHVDCDVSGGFEADGVIANSNGTYQFSSCAIRRALDANDLLLGDGAVRRLPTRAFVEPLR